MSNRRKPKSSRRLFHAAENVKRHLTTAELPWIWAMQDADEAERRGDAEAALAAIRRREIDPNGRPFWRACRVQSLEQLVALGSAAPGWAVSRWVLAQALQHLDPAEMGRATASRSARAAEVAIELRGGLAGLPGVDDVDRQVKVNDHDWMARQLQLYDLGALEAFLSTAATPDLVASADRIEEWAFAAMGGFRYLGASGGTLLWRDLETQTVFQTLNIGSAALVLKGEHVIGRLVPTAGGPILEGPPLVVPREVARDVARHPSAWLSVLQGAGELVREETINLYDPSWRTVLSDVPIFQTTMVLLSHGSTAASFMSLARDVLDLSLREVDDGSEDWWEGSALLHAAVVSPGVLAALDGALGPHDLEVLAEVAPLVAEPARGLLLRLVAGSREAA